MATTPNQTPRKAVKKTVKKAAGRTTTVVSKAADTTGNAIKSSTRTLNAHAQPLLTKGKAGLSKAATKVGSVTDQAIRAVKSNPKLAAAIATGVVSVASALAVKKINKPSTKSSLGKKTQDTTEQLINKLAEAAHSLSDKLRK